MSTNTQKAHFFYTIKEWSSIKHQQYLDIIFKNNDINVIFDIGANVGGTSKIFLDYCRKNKKNLDKIYCIEPDKENMDYLKNILSHEIEKGIINYVQKGIYYGKKTAKVYGMGLVIENKIHENVGGYGIDDCMIELKDIRNSSGENVFCDQISNKLFELDELENIISPKITPDFIKIDVEGAEKNILMNSKIIKNAKYLIVEWNHNNICFNEFIKKYLPNFKILSHECDFLLKNCKLI